MAYPSPRWRPRGGVSAGSEASRWAPARWGGGSISHGVGIGVAALKPGAGAVLSAAAVEGAVGASVDAVVDVVVGAAVGAAAGAAGTIAPAQQLSSTLSSLEASSESSRTFVEAGVGVRGGGVDFGEGVGASDVGEPSPSTSLRSGRSTSRCRRRPSGRRGPASAG